MSKVKRGRSAVWDHFEKVGEPGNKKCHCMHCDTVMNFCGNTTNLITHLSKHHKDIYLQVLPKIQEARPKFAPKEKRPRLLDENDNETEGNV